MYRKFQHRNARRCSGGVILYYREHLKHGIEVVKNNYDTIIWIKLKHDLFNLENDIYICGEYIWGQDSPAYNTVDVDLFETLENDISFFQEIGDVFFTGDFNSRVGNKSDFIVCDTLNPSTDIDGYIPDNKLSRASNNKSHNSHGLKLLDLCKTYSLRIVNGRIGYSNNFTFLSRNGSSVIDYLLTHEHNFPLLNSFQVGPFNEWSDDLCTKKLHYKSLLRKKKSAYYRLKMYEIENLKKSNTKQFWQYFKANKRQNQSNDISLDQFKTLFSNISNNTEDCNNNEAETFCENHDFNCLNDRFPELDNPITIAIKSLKCGKAFGNDCILNEYFIECADILAKHMCDLFNGISISGFFTQLVGQKVLIYQYTRSH